MFSERLCFVSGDSKRKDYLFRYNKWCQMRKEIKHILNYQMLKYNLTFTCFKGKQRKGEMRLELSVWGRLREVLIYSYLCYAYKSVIRASLSKMLELKPEFTM